MHLRRDKFQGGGSWTLTQAAISRALASGVLCVVSCSVIAAASARADSSICRLKAQAAATNAEAAALRHAGRRSKRAVCVSGAQTSCTGRVAHPWLRLTSEGTWWTRLSC